MSSARLKRLEASVRDSHDRTPAPNILVISGSPTNPSKTELLANMVTGKLSHSSGPVSHLKIRDLPAQALIGMDTSDACVAAAVARVEQADGIVVATPTFKASFSGLLKLFLDLLPQFGLTNKVVLPLATGGTLAHVLALDYGLRPVLQSMGARWVVPSFFVTSDAFISENDDPALMPKFRDGLNHAVVAFRDALGNRATDELEISAPGHKNGMLVDQATVQQRIVTR
jgi:FMN reductase